MLHWRKEAIADVINPVLGIGLLSAPWYFGFMSGGPATESAWISGVLIAIAAVVALIAFAEWEEWIALLFGLWAIVAPWVLGFASTNMIATQAHFVVGILVALLAVWELWQIHRLPGQTA
ncbi:MAG TPA: SPW repeat protein [Xanthobacteraceae bacterium]|nr:SPW repeat protein [Xanthobacteraceae bacterium]